MAVQAFKYAVSDLNLSKESAHIVERLQKLLSKELIDQKEDKIMDLKDEWISSKCAKLGSRAFSR